MVQMMLHRSYIRFGEGPRRMPHHRRICKGGLFAQAYHIPCLRPHRVSLPFVPANTQCFSECATAGQFCLELCQAFVMLYTVIQFDFVSNIHARDLALVDFWESSGRTIGSY